MKDLKPEWRQFHPEGLSGTHWEYAAGTTMYGGYIVQADAPLEVSCFAWLGSVCPSPIPSEAATGLDGWHCRSPLAAKEWVQTVVRARLAAASIPDQEL